MACRDGAEGAASTPQTIERAASLALCAHTCRDPGIFSRILSLAASKDWGKALPLACIGIEILAESPHRDVRPCPAGYRQQ
jgi:hypothetical protein